ncbi:hypothetical protein KAX17_04125 [Candidatus Bipolaricaulota bacterium]|nr:hypothetical protein [Candidatus Bipolaricaulota bacterium]
MKLVKLVLDQVIGNALGWFRKVLHHSLHRDGFPDNIPTLAKLDTHDKLGFAWFSDTVLFYTLQDNIDCYRLLCSTVAWLLFETMFDPHTRVRCGVSYGEAYIDKPNGLYVGEALIKAHKLEKAQMWSGGAFTKQAEVKLPAAARIGQLYDWFVVPYKVPLKDKQMRSTLAVDWTKGLHPEFTLPWSKSSPEPTPEDWKCRKDVCLKWQNTVKFHTDVCKQCCCQRDTQQLHSHGRG